MSSIIFSTKDKKVYLCGSERTHMALFIKNLAVASVWEELVEFGNEESVFRKILPNWVRKDADLRLNFHLSLQRGSLNKYDVFSLVLNSASDIGNDIVKLMCRLHAQCELHCYVKAENKVWMADTIKEGRKRNIFRSGVGWEEVIDLLLEDNPHPIVVSYSVCDIFPTGKKWKKAILKLLENDLLEIKPETFDEYRYDEGQTLIGLAYELKLQKNTQYDPRT